MRLIGLELAHPVLNASGTLDAIEADRLLGDATLGCAAHVTKTIFPEPRRGNAAPRIAEVAGGMINSIGLPGPGIDAFLAGVLPRIVALAGATPVIVSIGGESHDDYVRLAERVGAAPGVAALELNLSCPNVESGCISIGADVVETERVTRRVRASTRLPFLVKLSPSVSDIGALARAAAAGGADGLTLTNTARGMAMNRWTGRPLLGGPGGGLSGPPLRPLALAAVFAARAAVSIDIVGLGGVGSADDAADLLAAGATAIAVGTATFRDPGTAARVRDGLGTRGIPG
jgi:dihydroorotate dehydrogenase (NAD+) catalytic subunit